MPCTMPYGKVVMIVLDQAINAVVLRGWPDETLSSRCWRLSRSGRRQWPRRLIDCLFFWDRDKGKGHCELSFESEREMRQLPPECREERVRQFLFPPGGKGEQR